MTAQELILLDKGKVRRDSNLMSLYLVYFKEAYKYTPSCAGCSFGTDWQKFVSFYSTKEEKVLNLQKEIFMKITIKKIQGKILSYKKDGKTFRLYDNILTTEFIDGYLKNGSKEELAERKKLFNFPIVEEPKSILLIQTEKELKAFDENGIEKEIIFSEIPTKKKRGRKIKK